jgi:thiol-disulfide isomerase/thioredoxin
MCPAKSRLLVTLIGCLIAPHAFGSEATPTVANEPDFAEQCRVIRQDTERQLASLHKKIQSEADLTKDFAGQGESVKEALAESEAIQSSATERVFALVEPHAAESAAAENLAWVATMRGDSDTGRTAFDLLTQHHIVHPEAIKAVSRLSISADPRAKSLLQAQLASADLPQDLAWRVKLSMARLLQTEAAMASRLATGSEEECAPMIKHLGTERVAELRQADASALEEEAVGLFGEIERDYPEREVIPGVTAGEIAKSSVFEMTNLRVGKLAPDIVGEDLSGEALKLSDYRGKVVLLSFWATWCGPCMAEIPHERELVEMYKDQPFAIVGVNADIDRAELERSLEKSGISWRSFSCGPEGPTGPILKAWNVSSLPTVYLIDHAGVIRGKHIRGAALDAKLAELVPEAEKAMQR